jgi:hypothetical protein
MSDINDTITSLLVTAMKEKNTVARDTLRALKSALKLAALDKGGATGELTAPESLAVVRKQIKQRQDSVESFSKAGRDDLADKEKQEIAILESFLPAALSQEEIGRLIDEAIRQTGATTRKEMGAVMKILQETTDGRVDGKTLAAEVSRRLS